jgi:hypothetical protein
MAISTRVSRNPDAICPGSFDWGAPLELKTKFGEELDGGINVFHHDADVVHTLDGHDGSLTFNGLRLSSPRHAKPRSMPEKVECRAAQAAG